MYYILFILSCILYYLAPYKVDDILIYISLGIFICGAYNILLNDFKHKEYISFNIIFLLSFFFVTYCAPIFIVGTDSENELIVAKLVDFDYSTKATSLSTIAICCYFIGYNYYKNKKVFNKDDFLLNVSKLLPFFSKLLTLSTVALFINTCWVIVRDGFDIIAITDNSFITEFYKIFYIITLIINAKSKKRVDSFSEMVRNNKMIMIISLFIVLFFFYLGDRGLPIVIIISTLSVYFLFYKRIRLSTIILIGVLGVISMFIIRSTRKSGDAIKNSDMSTFVGASQEAIVGNSFITMFADLYGACQELYLGFEYKEKHGLLYPEQIIIIPFTPIPFFPTIISKIMFGKTPYEMSPGMVLNEYASTATVTTHLGDHIVSNIYIRWGIIGIILSFYLFGKCIRVFFDRRYWGLPYTACYIYLISHALYLPRASILDIIRPLVFIFFFIYLSEKKYRIKNE